MSQRDLIEVNKKLVTYVGQDGIHAVGYSSEGIEVYYERVPGNSIRALNQKLLIERMTAEADGVPIHFHHSPPATLPDE